MCYFSRAWCCLEGFEESRAAPAEPPQLSPAGRGCGPQRVHAGVPAGRSMVPGGLPESSPSRASPGLALAPLPPPGRGVLLRSQAAESSFPPRAPQVICVGASVPAGGARRSGARGAAAQSRDDGLGNAGPGGREGSALMSHAGARGAGNGNFWAALFIPRSGYKPSSPSPLSGGKFKPQLVLLGLAGGDGAVLATGWPGHKVPPSSWAGWLCPPLPKPPWRVGRPVSAEGSWDGSSQLPPGMCGGFPVPGGRGGGRRLWGAGGGHRERGAGGRQGQCSDLSVINCPVN